ncbi:quinolinate synthase NadA [bacterium]|nr:quinolinate synthase NadA [bacterium]
MEVKDYNSLSTAELRERIVKAKQKKSAVLLVHNYQTQDVQAAADYLGDSLGLAREAEKVDASIIVFCGVDFMAETAKILNPNKKVLLPDLRAACPMAAMIDAETLREAKKKYPEAVVVTYINSTAEVKALSDICCTSGNAIQVVKSLGNRQILFTPDKNLALYCQAKTGADIIPWQGHCYVHDNFKVSHLETAKAAHPDALFIAHPECRREVLELADVITSTSGMVGYIDDHQALIRDRGVIVGTEIGLVEQLIVNYPELPIFPLSPTGICATMKLTTLPKIAWCLENETNEILLNESIRQQAYNAVKRMLEIG